MESEREKEREIQCCYNVSKALEAKRHNFLMTGIWTNELHTCMHGLHSILKILYRSTDCAFFFLFFFLLSHLLNLALVYIQYVCTEQSLSPYYIDLMIYDDKKNI